MRVRPEHGAAGAEVMLIHSRRLVEGRLGELVGTGARSAGKGMQS